MLCKTVFFYNFIKTAIGQLCPIAAIKLIVFVNYSFTLLFFTIVQKYTRIDTLTHEVAREFIEKIIIHKAEKVDGHRQMKIDIFYNGIGKVDLPNEKA